MKVREKNTVLKELIIRLEERGRQENKPFWTALAKKLNKPRRNAYEVNLYELEKSATEKETIVVPGFVLGTGKISKPVNVAALKFTSKAREKITKAGGKTIDIEHFVEGKPKLKSVRIMG